MLIYILFKNGEYLVVSFLNPFSIIARHLFMIKFFNIIIDALNESKIPYMLSGSVAMSLYIVPRGNQRF